jgi:hypothetical protein
VLFKTLADVDGPFTSGQDGYLVSYIGSSSHVHLVSPASLATAVLAGATLESLGDVSVGGITSGQVLEWNGTAWVPYTIPASFAVSGTATNGYEITSVSGTPTWTAPPAQIAAAESGLKIIRGSVSSSPGVAYGAGYSVSGLGPGIVQVTFTTPFSAVPSVVAVGAFTTGDGKLTDISTANLATNGFTAYTNRWDGSPTEWAAAYRAFDFIALGPA